MTHITGMTRHGSRKHLVATDSATAVAACGTVVTELLPTHGAGTAAQYAEYAALGGAYCHRCINAVSAAPKGL